MNEETRVVNRYYAMLQQKKFYNGEREIRWCYKKRIFEITQSNRGPGWTMYHCNHCLHRLDGPARDYKEPSTGVKMSMAESGSAAWLDMTGLPKYYVHGTSYTEAEFNFLIKEMVT